MARIKLRKILKPKSLYPGGWPGNMLAILYLNRKRKSRGVPGQGLETDTFLTPSTEMSFYG